uniref:interferon-inducible GTPase 1-like n=1 Tax=Euleptes europaea TaxID=460621 RepID=UPI00254043B8|nr:interferon-inducible GTPase 1-like [Euleptes europaea]
MGGKNSTQQGCNIFEKNTLDIAVTGLSGAGKSSFVNSLRGLSDFDEEAAKTDVIEGTIEPVGYPLPAFPHVTIWDLPGIGTPRFKAEEYLEKVNYSQYDFFIIVASNRFTISDIQLSHAVQKMEKRFYYVRSKMDVSIKNEKMKPDFIEEATLQKIRKYCLDNLVQAGLSSPEIFLISNWYPDKYDFPHLQRTLENEMEDFERRASAAEKENHEKSTELSRSTGIYSFLSKAALTFDLAKLRDIATQKCLKEVIAKIHQESEALENAELNIAITGASGTGKSSVVNALRGMTDYEEDAAKSGVVETTMDPNGYTHPLFPNVTLWDLPGIGTPEFKPEDYLNKVNFSKYDFFIIVSSERFTVNDTMLAREIQKRKKKFYYVRSKMDISIASEAMKPDFDMDKTVEEIRTYCCENLRRAGETSPRVFLISRRDLSSYDFPILQEAFENDLDDLKRHAFIASLPVFSRKILKKKKAAMEDLIWKVATEACSIAMIPSPALALVCDLSLLVVTMKSFCKVFGLDEDSLQRVAQLVGKDYNVLKSAIKKSPVSSEITLEFVNGLLAKSWLCSTVTVTQEVLDFIPLLGYLAGGASSFITTYHMLKCFLRDLVQDAENLRAKAAEP